MQVNPWTQLKMLNHMNGFMYKKKHLAKWFLPMNLRPRCSSLMKKLEVKISWYYPFQYNRFKDIEIELGRYCVTILGPACWFSLAGWFFYKLPWLPSPPPPPPQRHTDNNPLLWQTIRTSINQWIGFSNELMPNGRDLAQNKCYNEGQISTQLEQFCLKCTIL